MKPSTRLILDALLRGERLTPQIALRNYGCMSLSQRVGEIVLSGVAVVSERVPGEAYNRYYIQGTRPTKPETPKVVVREHLRTVPARCQDETLPLFG